MIEDNKKMYRNVVVFGHILNILLITISTIGYFLILNYIKFDKGEMIFSAGMLAIYIIALISITISVMVGLSFRFKSKIRTTLSYIITPSLLILFFMYYVAIKYELQVTFIVIWSMCALVRIVSSMKYIQYVNDNLDRLFEEFLSIKVMTLDEYKRYQTVNLKKRKYMNILIFLSMAMSKIDYLIYVMLIVVLVYELYCIRYYSKEADKKGILAYCFAIAIYGLLLALTIVTQIGIINIANTNYKDVSLFIFMISIPSLKYYILIRREIWKYDARKKINGYENENKIK